LLATGAVVAARAKPAAPPITVTGMASSSGWLVQFHLPPGARDVQYRLPDDRAFETLGSVSWIHDPTTQRPMAQTWVTIPFDRIPGPTTIEVRWVDADGIARGPTALRFEPASEAVASTRSILGMVTEWVAFRPGAELRTNGTYLYFTTLLVYKYALREIRWSVDSEDLERRVHFTPSDRPGIANDDELYAVLPGRPGFVAVQLVYIDGSTSPIRRFAPTSIGTGASTLPIDPRQKVPDPF
jgi:hypothetical protein